MNFGECPRRFARSTSLCALVALFLLGGETRAQTVHGSWSDSSPEPPLEGYTVTLELLDALPTQTIHGREVRRARVGTDLRFRVRLTNESGFPMSAGSFSQTFSFQRISRVLPKPPGVDEFPAPYHGEERREAVLVVGKRVDERGLGGAAARSDHEIDVCHFVAVADERLADQYAVNLGH